MCKSREISSGWAVGLLSIRGSHITMKKSELRGVSEATEKRMSRLRLGRGKVSTKGESLDLRQLVGTDSGTKLHRISSQKEKKKESRGTRQSTTLSQESGESF